MVYPNFAFSCQIFHKFFFIFSVKLRVIPLDENRKPTPDPVQIDVLVSAQCELRKKITLLYLSFTTSMFSIFYSFLHVTLFMYMSWRLQFIVVNKNHVNIFYRERKQNPLYYTIL